jgi:hypothetical protein
MSTSYLSRSGDGNFALDCFIDTALDHGFIGHKNAGRLLHDRWPGLFFAVGLREQLRNTGDKNLKVGKEVVAAALRSASDFDADQTVLIRPHLPRTNWMLGTITDAEGDEVIVQTSPLNKLVVPATFPGLIDAEDATELASQRKGIGHPTACRFVLGLSNFDPDYQADPVFVQNAIRHLPASVATLLRSQ